MASDERRSKLLSEKRGQPRIQAHVNVRIINPATDHAQHALLVNLSWGGALIECREPPGAVGERIDVELPYHVGEAIRIESEILRVGAGNNGRQVVAARFSSISSSDEDHLEKVLEMLLAGPGGGKRAHPRLAQRLEIYFDDPAEVRATLEDISHGGLAVTVPSSFDVNQSVQLTVLGGVGIGELRFRARIVRQEPVIEGDLRLFRIGLVFEHPTKDLENMVGWLLRKLASREETGSRAKQT